MISCQVSHLLLSNILYHFTAFGVLNSSRFACPHQPILAQAFACLFWLSRSVYFLFCRPMVWNARLLWLAQQVHAGRSVSVSFSYHEKLAGEKGNFVLDPDQADMHTSAYRPCGSLVRRTGSLRVQRGDRQRPQVIIWPLCCGTLDSKTPSGRGIPSYRSRGADPHVAYHLDASESSDVQASVQVSGNQ